MPDKPRKLTQKEQQAEIRKLLIAAPEVSNRSIARNIGCSHVTVATVRKELEDSGQINRTGTPEESEWLSHPYIQQNPHIVDNLNERGLRAIKNEQVLNFMAERGLTSPRYALRVIRKQEKAARKKAGVNLKAKDIIIRQDDLLTGLPWIKNESCDLILTDLPYSRDYLPLYRALSNLAGRVLKDNGASLLCMTGHSALPEILNALCSDERLRYHWLISVIMPRSHANLNWLKVSPSFKPVIWLTKGLYEGDFISDIVKAKPADKAREIEWEQPQDVFNELANRFIQRGGVTLLDPCCGSGTSLLAGIQTGLCSRIIGVDNDPECVRLARRRVDEMIYAGDE